MKKNSHPILPVCSPTEGKNGTALTMRDIDPRPRADHVMIGFTQSLCPDCMNVVPAKIVRRGKRVYFQKRCKEHGSREDFVCSDVAWWDLAEGHTAAVLPKMRGTEVREGCPHDCGLCEEHEQHTCIGLIELADRCNLSCPTCFASSGPGKADHSYEDVLRALDRLIESEGHAEVCQLSGGEPTLHTEFERIVDAALERPIDYVMINTNGIRLAKDPALVDFLSDRKSRVEVYFQWDGEDRDMVRRIRGEDLVDTKLRALERLESAGIHVTLVSTLAAPLPVDFYDRLLRRALEYSNVVGLSLQPATYSGRFELPDELENRVTFPDVIYGLANASGGQLLSNDFAPLPCAHPNCHQIMLAAQDGKQIVPLSRAADVRQHLDLLAGGISFTQERSQKIIELFLARQSHCGSDCGCHELPSFQTSPDGNGISPEEERVLSSFMARVLSGTATATDLFRVTITSFLDRYNFDVRQLMKCCTHHVLPSGHIVPFCAYNTLYREGHLTLPSLVR